ncbi:hypothetical protein CCR97_07920 [Rhodoplanes elegans]|uniref:Uncharacterized protein n=1 Tax=Rhodoplanes elegans TaxID=29408 RepID=A0A327KR32_9BRAD|nr:hypothetical protein [Rhodoplanes elegans]MBK5958137.1 hypothetical protein [Rhodoplanes elegans]RAI40424.1 hypothetical protein CH338_06170 [Rhodoplanes elegans]
MRRPSWSELPKKRRPHQIVPDGFLRLRGSPFLEVRFRFRLKRNRRVWRCLGQFFRWNKNRMPKRG